MRNFLHRSYFLPLVCFGLLALLSCEDDPAVEQGPVEESAVANVDQPIEDAFGRTLLLHGLNTSSSAKGHPERQPWIVESDVEREATEFGFNFVRYLIFWDGVEPEQGVYDEAYLDKVEERVNWYTSRGMYVMLDMHQDLYSISFGGDGAPYWALQTNGHTFQGAGGPWWLANIDPAVIACWENFWRYTDHQYLQDHYIAMWQKVAERFDSNPYVIGYDVMNEPWGGDIVKTIVTGDFERFQLSAFYERLIPALREVSPDKYLFLEPAPAPVTFGSPSRLPVLNDTRAESRIVYAPHCYPFDTHEGIGYTDGSRNQLNNWERERQAEVRKHGRIPLVCGEFGLSPNTPGFDEYLSDVLLIFDRNTWSWTYWSNDLGGWSPLDGDRNETPILPYLIRTYPRATSGALESVRYDNETHDFSMTFVSDDTGMPTEIFIPRRHYPNGYEITVTGTEDYTTSFDEVTQVLQLNVAQAARRIEVEITAL